MVKVAASVSSTAGTQAMVMKKYGSKSIKGTIDHDNVIADDNSSKQSQMAANAGETNYCLK